jgi:hypothetical protein
MKLLIMIVICKHYPFQRDIFRSMYWFRKAANQGHINSSNNLYDLYKRCDSLIIKKDINQALYWLKKSNYIYEEYLVKIKEYKDFSYILFP